MSPSLFTYETLHGFISIFITQLSFFYWADFSSFELKVQTPLDHCSLPFLIYPSFFLSFPRLDLERNCPWLFPAAVAPCCSTAHLPSSLNWWRFLGTPARTHLPGALCHLFPSCTLPALTPAGIELGAWPFLSGFLVHLVAGAHRAPRAFWPLAAAHLSPGSCPCLWSSGCLIL